MKIRHFAIVIGNDVATKIIVVNESEQGQRVVAALQSDPKIIDISEINPEIDFGWTYDGTNFTPPQA